jgi:DNA replication protein DnaC
MKNMLFNMRPNLKEKITVDDIMMKKFKCSQCGEETIDGWEFELDGKLQQITAASICNACGTKELSRQVTQELSEKRMNQLISNWYYLSDKESSGFKNFEPLNDLLKDARQKAMNYTGSFSQDMLQEKNLLIMGSTGTGKSHLSKAIARTLKARGFKVGYLSAVELFNKIKATFDSGSAERLYEEMKKLDLLVIDDVGVETTKINDVSWTVRTWSEIIEARLGMCNVWTTNLDDTSLSEVVGARAHSRMYDSSRFIDLFTDDYRKTKTIKG